eukprot:9833687-Alexandrium_andersonii.AAC.1
MYSGSLTTPRLPGISWLRKAGLVQFLLQSDPWVKSLPMFLSKRKPSTDLAAAELPEPGQKSMRCMLHGCPMTPPRSW